MAAEPPLDELPEARVERGRGLSLVWLVPLVALLVGGWLVYKTLSERGPRVTVAFAEAEGLEVGKTRVRYKDVEVGKVRDIQLSDDLQQVLVTLDLNRSIGEHLGEDSRFWIVRPRISSSGVSGLTTLLSGIYVAVDPGSDASGARDFYQGLDEPPRIESSAAGSSFLLSADSLGSLDVGSPVYLRQIQVGEVVRYALRDDGRGVMLTVFINAPYDRLVHTNTRFWNASGFHFSVTSEGVRAHIESVAALLTGGIAFETPQELDAGQPAGPDTVFTLYPDHDSVSERPHRHPLYYVMHFDGSLRGLHVGAPVEFRGIKVGEVRDIELKMDAQTLAVELPVLVTLYPEAASLSGDIDDPAAAIETLVRRGLRAQLKTGNLLTGQLYIDLEFHDDAPPAQIVAGEPYPEFPTLPAPLEKIARSASDLLEKVQQMPLLEITQDLRDTIHGLKQLVNSPRSSQTIAHLDQALVQLDRLARTLNEEVPGIASQLQDTLRQAEQTLAAAGNALGEDSPLYYDLRQLIDEMAQTANSFRALTDYLQRHPDALLYGKEPRGRR